MAVRGDCPEPACRGMGLLRAGHYGSGSQDGGDAWYAWTKAWGMMYLASFLDFEGMALIAKRLAEALPDDQTPPLASYLDT
jgi:hypothetical protein